MMDHSIKIKIALLAHHNASTVMEHQQINAQSAIRDITFLGMNA